MIKKIVILATAVITILGVLGLTACDGVRLTDYKTTKASQLQDYADAKGENNYTAENWALLQQSVANGKKKIKKSLSKTAVDKAVTTSKTAINAFEREDENLEWTNENAVYASVKTGFEGDILQDIKRAFETLNFQKVYVTRKDTDTWTSLELLFILNDTTNQDEFIDLLLQDTRINGVRKCNDFPFEAVDTRHIERAKDTIAVGETLKLEIKGNYSFYTQPFSFKGLLVKPRTNKIYTVEDFPVDLKSVEVREDGWLHLELETESYYSVVKSTDILLRFSSIQEVKKDLRGISLWMPRSWRISDRNIVDFVAGVESNGGTKYIKGIKTGKVTIYYDNISCEITVI